MNHESFYQPGGMVYEAVKRRDEPHPFVADTGEPSRVKYGEDDIAHCARCGQAENRPIHRVQR